MLDVAKAIILPLGAWGWSIAVLLPLSLAGNLVVHAVWNHGSLPFWGAATWLGIVWFFLLLVLGQRNGAFVLKNSEKLFLLKCLLWGATLIVSGSIMADRVPRDFDNPLTVIFAMASTLGLFLTALGGLLFGHLWRCWLLQPPEQ